MHTPAAPTIPPNALSGPRRFARIGCYAGDDGAMAPRMTATKNASAREGAMMTAVYEQGALVMLHLLDPTSSRMIATMIFCRIRMATRDGLCVRHAGRHDILAFACNVCRRDDATSRRR